MLIYKFIIQLQELAPIKIETRAMLSFQTVEESAGTSDVQSKSQCSRSVHHDSCAAVQKPVQAAPGHVLGHRGQCRRLVHAAQHRQDVGVREDAQLGELLVEVAGDARGALAHLQDLGHDVVVLPATAPGLSAGALGEVRVQREVRHEDALVPGQGRVPAPGLEAEPALVLELDLLQVLPELDCQVCGNCEQLEMNNFEKSSDDWVKFAKIRAE